LLGRGDYSTGDVIILQSVSEIFKVSLGLFNTYVLAIGAKTYFNMILILKLKKKRQYT